MIKPLEDECKRTAAKIIGGGGNFMEFLIKIKGDGEMITESNKNHYIDLAKHCIGLDRKKPYKRHEKLFYTPYRNFFATGKSYDDWEVLESAGYAERGEQNQHGGYTFYLTRSGLDWLGEQIGIHIHDEMD